MRDDGSSVDAKYKTDENGNLTGALYRNSSDRSSSTDYPHMNVSYDGDGDVDNAHYSPSRNSSDRVGTESGEWEFPETGGQNEGWGLLGVAANIVGVDLDK